MTYLLLLVGFVLLIKGADFFVEGSSSIARLLKIPSVIIGLTIVALGTSSPEAAVSITASLAGNNDIAFSNVIGSNIFNFLMVVGICAALGGVNTNRDILKRDLPLNIGVTLLLLIFMIDLKLNRLEAAILLVVLITYMVLLIRNALKNRTQQEETKVLSPIRSILYIIGGLAAIIIGGQLVVNSSSEIAASFGLSQTLIGLTIVAVGTSLPELVTSIVAARKGENELALGNALGSSIFNILFILGLSAALSPITAVGESIIDCIILLVVGAIMLIFSKTDMKTVRGEGIFCILCYIGYMAYIIMRSIPQ